MRILSLVVACDFDGFGTGNNLYSIQQILREVEQMFFAKVDDVFIKRRFVLGWQSEQPGIAIHFRVNISTHRRVFTYQQLHHLAIFAGDGHFNQRGGQPVAGKVGRVGVDDALRIERAGRIRQCRNRSGIGR